LRHGGYQNFYVDAGGDVQADGTTRRVTLAVGIRNPFNLREIVKVLSMTQFLWIATSGT